MQILSVQWWKKLQSEHTRLINKFIGLCKKNGPADNRDRQRFWPNPLHELGYKVEVIEQYIKMRSGDTVKPDVLAVSNKNLHALVSECKSSKSLREDQDRRYTDLSPSDLTNFAKVYDQEQLRHDVCYVVGIENHASLSAHTNLPFITFGQHVERHGEFRLSKLNEKLAEPIPLDGLPEPTSYYPFAPSDEDKFVVPYVFRAVVKCLSSDNVEDRAGILESGAETRIMKELDPQNLIARKHRKEMEKRIMHVIGTLCKQSEFVELVERAQSSRAAIQVLASKCGKMSDRACSEYERQHRLTDEF